jgi:hypothetical protein
MSWEEDQVDPLSVGGAQIKNDRCVSQIVIWNFEVIPSVASYELELQTNKCYLYNV